MIEILICFSLLCAVGISIIRNQKEEERRRERRKKVERLLRQIERSGWYGGD